MSRANAKLILSMKRVTDKAGEGYNTVGLYKTVSIRCTAIFALQVGLIFSVRYFVAVHEMAYTLSMFRVLRK